MMLLTRKSSERGTASSSSLVSSLARGVGRAIPTMDRRAFLRRSGLGVGVGLATSQLTLVQKAKAADPPAGNAAPVIRRTVCSHCSVGCAVDAVVENGVWTRQEPVFDSPINLGAHCAKGAALREHGHGDYRLKTPMKLVNGKYQKISWDEALNEISAKMLDLKKTSGPDSIFVVGSSKHNNEQAYLLRKWMTLWGSNNCDHQARICHSTTVAGVANTWGYGAMTNSYNDMRNTKCAMYIGSNAAEAHPVSMLHMLHAKETGREDDRRRPALHADRGEGRRVRADPLRLGHPVPVRRAAPHLQERLGRQEVHRRPRLRHGEGQGRGDGQVDARQGRGGVRRAGGRGLQGREDDVGEPAEHDRLVHGPDQHTIGNAIVRASCILQLALGNIGVSGGGANIFRGHDNVQGATDVGPNPDSLPGYYGLAEGAFKHFASAWKVDFEWIKKQYAPGMLTKPGMTVSRWVDGVLEKNELIDQDSNLRGLFFWGHAPNSQTRGIDMKRAMDKLDLLVIIDPYPSASAAMAAMPGAQGDLNPNRAVYLLPAATQFECAGSVTASNRSIQWREKVIEPLFDSRNDHMIMYQLAQKLGFDKELVAGLKMVPGKGGMQEPEVESILREINRTNWTIGYTGQSPERLKAHMRNMNVFDVKTLRAKGGIDKETGYSLDGDYFGLPWPCYGTPEMKHPARPTSTRRAST
jgi:formate dehydrogenase major subunit